MNKRSIFFATILIAATVVVKFICAPRLELSGFTTIMAIALFGGMAINQKNNSFLLPLIALFVSDAVIEICYQMKWFAFPGLYKSQLVNYALLLLTVLVGWFVKGKTYVSVGLAAFIAPTLFFLLSNFETWAMSNMYAHNTTGLIECYVAAIPFYAKSVASTMVILPLVIYFYNALFTQKAKVVLA